MGSVKLKAPLSHYSFWIRATSPIMMMAVSKRPLQSPP